MASFDEFVQQAINNSQANRQSLQDSIGYTQLPSNSQSLNNPLNNLSDEEFAQKYANVDGAKYKAAMELGDTSGVDPDTYEVANSNYTDLKTKYGVARANALIDKFQSTANAYTNSNDARSPLEVARDTAAAVGGGVAGLIGGGATVAAYGLESGINSLTGSNDHSITKSVASGSQALSDFFNNDLTSAARIAQRNREQALSDYRDTLSELQYQKDLREGSSEMSAGFAKFGRDIWNGMTGVFDSGSKALETGANVFGSLGGFSLGIKAGTKLAAKMVDKGLLPRFLSTMGTEERNAINKTVNSLVKQGVPRATAESQVLQAIPRGLGDRLGAPAIINAMAVGGEGIEGALNQLDSVTNEELLEGSPVGKLYYDSFRANGSSHEEAMKLMRDKIEASILKSAFGAGLLAGATSGKLFEKVLRNPFTVNESQSLLGNMARESMEESWETLPTPATNYAMHRMLILTDVLQKDGAEILVNLLLVAYLAVVLVMLLLLLLIMLQTSYLVKKLKSLKINLL